MCVSVRNSLHGLRPLYVHVRFNRSRTRWGRNQGIAEIARIAELGALCIIQCTAAHQSEQHDFLRRSLSRTNRQNSVYCRLHNI